MGAYLGVNWMGLGKRIDQNNHNSMSVITPEKQKGDIGIQAISKPNYATGASNKVDKYILHKSF